MQSLVIGPNWSRMTVEYSVLGTRYLRGTIVVLLSAVLLGASDDSAARFNLLGHKMICGCGCNQILLECNHVGCPLSDGMRTELSVALTRGDSDDLVLQAFVQKYGPTILAAPTTTGFNRVAWIMPFLVLLAGFASAVLIVRSWKDRSLTSEPAEKKEPSSDDFREQIRRETEL